MKLPYEEYGVEVFHHIGADTCVKQTRIPAGRWLVQHVHSYEHLSVVVSGTARVEVEGCDSLQIEGPGDIVVPAGRKHRVSALTDVIWLCVHHTPTALASDKIVADEPL